MKKIGFWKEEGYPNTPSIYDYIDKTLDKERKMSWFLFFYLQNSPRIVTTFDLHESIIDGEPIRGEVIRTDGTWVWSDSILHYYRNNGLTLPDEFVKSIRRKIIPYPLFFGMKVLFTMGKIKTRIYENLVKEFSEEESDVPPRE